VELFLPPGGGGVFMPDAEIMTLDDDGYAAAEAHRLLQGERDEAMARRQTAAARTKNHSRARGATNNTATAPPGDNDVDIYITAGDNVELFLPPGGGGVFLPEAEIMSLDDDGYAAAEAHRLLQEERDEAMVRQLSQPLDHEESSDLRMAQQLQDEELARRYSRIEELQATTSTFLDDRNMNNDTCVEQDVDTAEYAHRIAYEMEDAEMANRLSIYEQEAASRREVLQQQQPSRRSTVVSRVVPLLCCGVANAIVLLFVLGVIDIPDDVPILGDINFGSDDWIDLDPWGGNTTNSDGHPPSSYHWQNNGNGLTLEILNAMDDSWQANFATAVANWDAGAPIDSLTLRVTRINYEIDCIAVTGKMKVCNADYGPTQWRGLNEVLVNRRDNEIVSSSAKMNEYYLTRESNDQKLYTVCHEIGHGFGLPHWDEDFFNKDLGNCMDYTNNPANNKLPDASNFIYLGNLYGDAGGSTSSATVAAENEAPAAGGPNNNRPNNNGPAGGNNNRNLRSISSRILQTDNVEHQRRVVLEANEYYESHWEAIDDDMGILYHYRMA
jgi:hypothetical protein